MKKLFLFLASVLLSFIGIAQQPAASCGAKNSDDQCCQKEQQDGFTTLSVDPFSKAIRQNDVVLVDVRTAKEFAAGHLKGARNVEWVKAFEENVKAASLPKDKTIAVYCQRGRRSLAATQVLVKMGYKVLNLDGGIDAWQKAGKPVVK